MLVISTSTCRLEPRSTGLHYQVCCQRGFRNSPIRNQPQTMRPREVTRTKSETTLVTNFWFCKYSFKIFSLVLSSFPSTVFQFFFSICLWVSKNWSVEPVLGDLSLLSQSFSFSKHSLKFWSEQVSFSQFQKNVSNILGIVFVKCISKKAIQ